MKSFSPIQRCARGKRLLIIGISLILLPLAAGCRFQVNSTVDAVDAILGDGRCETAAGACTLRAAVMEANASTRYWAGLGTTFWPYGIEVPNGLYRLTLPIGSGGGRLRINQSMNIRGRGPNTIIQGNSPPADTDSVIHVESGEVNISNVTITGGNAQNGGGLIVEAATTVELHEVIIRNNYAHTGGGGLLIMDGGLVRIRRSAITDNDNLGAFGGGIHNRGELWVYDSTISNNRSNRAGGIRNHGTMILLNTTISGNVATSGTPGGGGAGTGGISQFGYAVLNNVTITNNTGVGNATGSFIGGGIHTITGKTTLVKNSIIAGNKSVAGTDGVGPVDCVGALTPDSKYNLIGDPKGCLISLYRDTYAGYNMQTGDLDPVNPQLSPLGNNGAGMETHLPAGTSKALDKGYQFAPPAVDACEKRDQRGVPRPQGSGKCDMGAVEITSANVFVTALVLVDAAANTDIRPLLHGDTLFLSELPSELSVRAVVTGTPGSVVFGLDGTPSFRTENASPYALAGDTAGDYNPATLSEGVHTITAAPFAAAGGAGSAGGSYSVTFTIRGPSPVQPLARFVSQN